MESKSILNMISSLEILLRIHRQPVDSGFDDWYLPTKNELELVYNQIGNFGNYHDIETKDLLKVKELKNLSIFQLYMKYF